MNNPDQSPDNTEPEVGDHRTRDGSRYKKLTRPAYAAKRGKSPARLRGMHRRRRKRMGW